MSRTKSNSGWVAWNYIVQYNVLWNSFNHSEKELLHRRRRRRRSASCSSPCCESDGACCRLDSGQSRSTHSVTGASSRNSSSRSEKSSTRSSRSPSIEHIKGGSFYYQVVHWCFRNPKFDPKPQKDGNQYHSSTMLKNYEPIQ